jgi:glycosyltransferase involved in cell wall biosynthesis
MNTLFFINEDIRQSSGISKKILSQVKALRGHSNKCYFCRLVTLDNKLIRKVDDTNIGAYSKGNLGKLQSLIYFDSLYSFIVSNNVDVMYIRYTHYANPMFIRFLKKLKEIGVKILVEIPTYPYDHEYAKASSFSKWKLLVDKAYRGKIGKYIHKFITFSNDDYIWNKETIKISNAVDPDLVPLSKSKFDGESLIFIGVSNLATWHGYDRLIRSIANYYQVGAEHKLKVYFDVVGDGPIYNELKVLALDLDVDKYITFFGSLDGVDLNEVFDKANIGVDSLGRHRSGSFHNNSLKSKEYLFRGLPIIMSHEDISLSENDLFIKLSANEDVFDIFKLVDWYTNSKFEKEKIRAYAMNIFTWDIQTQKILRK